MIFKYYLTVSLKREKSRFSIKEYSKVFRLKTGLIFYANSDKKKNKMGFKVEIARVVDCRLYFLFRTQMFGGAFKISGELHSQLNKPNLTPRDLFSIPNIMGDIRQNIELFFSFCQKRKTFTTELVQICLNSSYERLEDPSCQGVACNTIQIFTYDEDALSTFLFPVEDHQGAKTDSKISEREQEGSIKEMISDAQRLFTNDEAVDQWKNQQNVFEKYEVVKLTLEILKNPNKNQTCLGYLNKIYSSLIRREATEFLQFLSLNHEYVDMILEGIDYFAIGNLLVLILSSEDKSGQYKFQEFKKQIFQKLMTTIFDSLGDPDKFEQLLSTVEQILNTTKHSYYQFFDDYKRCAQILVKEQTLKKFVSCLKAHQGQQFINALCYLELIMKKINLEKQDSENYYYEGNSGYTIKFQHQFMLHEVDSFIEMGKQIISGKYDSLTKISYFSFIGQLLENTDYRQTTEQSINQFKIFIELMIKQKSYGMVKNAIYQLISQKIDKMDSSVLTKVINWFYDEETIVQELRKINPNQNIKKINSNENGCFLSSILHNFRKKCPQYFENVEEIQKEKANQIFNKYEVKLAKQEEKPFKSILQSDFKLELPINSMRMKENQKDEDTQLGKLQIPGFNIPQSEQIDMKIETQDVKALEIPTLCRNSMIEEFKSSKSLEDQQESQEQTISQNNQEQEESEGQIKFFVRHLILF